MNQQQRRLAAWVIIDSRAYGPDDDLPANIAARITNPHAWHPDPPPPPAPDGTITIAAPSPRPLQITAEPATPETADAGEDAPRVYVVPPPRSGKGSGIDAWSAYAQAVNAEVPAGADRTGIILACEQAGRLPTSDDA